MTKTKPNTKATTNPPRKVGVKAKKGISKELRAILKRTEITNCTNCDSTKCYTNPFSTCDFCKKRFCFDCINCGAYQKGKENEEIRNVCDKCMVVGKYKTI